MVKKYIKKPVVIEAVPWTGNNVEEIIEFCGSDNAMIQDEYFVTKLYILTLEGRMEANVGDYIIKGVAGEFYPCKQSIFNKTYEEVKE